MKWVIALKYDNSICRCFLDNRTWFKNLSLPHVILWQRKGLTQRTHGIIPSTTACISIQLIYFILNFSSFLWMGTYNSSKQPQGFVEAKPCTHMGAWLMCLHNALAACSLSQPCARMSHPSTAWGSHCDMVALQPSLKTNTIKSDILKHKWLAIFISRGNSYRGSKFMGFC